MNDLAHELRRALGPTDLRLEPSYDFLTVEWDTGHLSLMVADLIDHDFDEDPDPYRYSIYYRPHDRFGVTGAAVCDYRLGLDATQSEIVHALVHAIRHRRHNIAPPSPFRWGLARATRVTQLCDALADVGLTVAPPLGTFVRTPANRAGRAVTISVGRDADEPTIVWVGRAGADSFLDYEQAAGWVFDQSAPPELVAQTAAYWGHDGALDDPGAPDPDRPFPLPRVGLTRDIDAGLGPLIEQLHRAGMEVLRVDLAINRSPAERELPGRDVITMRDDELRLLLLSRDPHPDAPWHLHAALYGPDLEVPLASVALPDHLSRSRAADKTEAAAGVAAAVAVAVAAMPAPGEADTLVTAPQRFPAPVLTLAGNAYLDDMFLDLRLLLTSDDASDHDAPVPTLIRTPHDAEHAAAAWMRWMGFSDAEATPLGTDEGIDVHSSLAVAQVKTETVPVGRPALQRLFGVAHAEGKDGLFFSLSGYTVQAAEWADRVGLPLFTFDYQGAAVPGNEPARDLYGTAGR